MTVWKGLFKKEWKLIRLYTLLSIIVSGTAPILFYSLSRYFKDQELFLLFSGMFIMMQIFIMPIILLTSLNIEGRDQLWLHNPNSMLKLVLAKFGYSFFTFAGSFLITIIMMDIGVYLLGVFDTSLEAFSYKDILNIGFIGIGTIVTISIYFSIWLFFYWTIYHALASIAPKLKSVRWPILIGIFLSLEFLIRLVQNSSLYTKLKEMFVLRIPYLSMEKSFSGSSFKFSIGPINPADSHLFAEIFLINWLCGIAISILMFVFSVWLLERKVEV